MDDFLYVLKLMLIKDLTEAQVNDQLQLYENYINEQVASGKTLEEVFYHLGDPEKIAELIVDKYRNGPISQKKEEEAAKEAAMADLAREKQAELKGQPQRRLSFREEMERRRNMTAEEINAEIQNPDHGFHAEFKENEGWDIRLGKLKLNTWYGTFIILGIILVIFILIHEIPGWIQ